MISGVSVTSPVVVTLVIACRTSVTSGAIVASEVVVVPEGVFACGVSDAPALVGVSDAAVTSGIAEAFDVPVPSMAIAGSDIVVCF